MESMLLYFNHNSEITQPLFSVAEHCVSYHHEFSNFLTKINVTHCVKKITKYYTIKKKTAPQGAHITIVTPSS